MVQTEHTDADNSELKAVSENQQASICKKQDVQFRTRHFPSWLVWTAVFAHCFVLVAAIALLTTDPSPDAWGINKMIFFGVSVCISVMLLVLWFSVRGGRSWAWTGGFLTYVLLFVCGLNLLDSIMDDLRGLGAVMAGVSLLFLLGLVAYSPRILCREGTLRHRLISQREWWAVASVALFLLLCCITLLCMDYIVCSRGYMAADKYEREARHITASISDVYDAKQIRRLDSLRDSAGCPYNIFLRFNHEKLINVSLDDVWTVGKNPKKLESDGKSFVDQFQWELITIAAYMHNKYKNKAFVEQVLDGSDTRWKGYPAVSKEILDDLAIDIRYNVLSGYAEVAGLLRVNAALFAILLVIYLVYAYLTFRGKKPIVGEPGSDTINGT